MNAIPFLDLSAVHDEVRSELDHVWSAVCKDNAFIGGPFVEAFEQHWADYCGRRHAIGVANGTDALELILTGSGIGPGDEVIVPANTFLATAEAVCNVGAAPVFVDVDPDTLLIEAPAVEAAITSRTSAVMVVHLYGQMADVDAIGAVCERAGIALIEDAAQAHGATWNGRRAGSFGVAAGFSFYPGKNLGAFGDGGIVVTDDDDLAERVRSIANHGRSFTDRDSHPNLGRNSRLDGLQAAVLDVKLDHLDRWNAGRRAAHAAYREFLPETVRLVGTRPEVEGVYHLRSSRSMTATRSNSS
jgi:dTDP-4-amino-4,6-dideoxygalactose transaminase